MINFHTALLSTALVSNKYGWKMFCGLEPGEMLLITFALSVAIVFFKAWLDDRAAASGLRMKKQVEDARRRCAAISRWNRTAHICMRTKDLRKLDNAYYDVSYDHPEIAHWLEQSRSLAAQDILQQGTLQDACHEHAVDVSCDHPDCEGHFDDIDD
jgi:hypothetical protein